MKTFYNIYKLKPNGIARYTNYITMVHAVLMPRYKFKKNGVYTPVYLYQRQVQTNRLKYLACLHHLKDREQVHTLYTAYIYSRIDWDLKSENKLRF